MNRPFDFALKRTFDVGVSGLALILLSPLFGGIMLAIWLDDGRPIFFAQARSGKHGKVFQALKFRTMVVDAEKMGPGLEIVPGDERITRVGRFLRHWTLDEIPQLFNVLRGDMSIVGPRPTLPSQVERYMPHQRRRLEMRPGMAGWAWIHGRNRIPWSERIELDIWYIDHFSFGLDLKILVKAVVLLLRHEGVYADDGAVRDL